MALRTLVAIWLGLVLARPAHAEPAIVLAEVRDSPALPALASQVELHASTRASVRTLSERDTDPVAFAQRASQLVASGDASIVIWIARVDHGYLVFAAGSWPGRALVELVRADETSDPAELERTIALKVAGLLDVLLAPRADVRDSLGVGARPAAPAGAPADAPPADAPPADAPPARWRIEVAGLVAREPRGRLLDGRAALSVSRAWVLGPWRLAPALAAHWQPSATVERASGRAAITELGLALAVEGARSIGPLEVFARPRFVLATLLAEGESRDGRRGDATVLAPYGGLELGVRHRISGAASVGVTGGCDLALIHHELLIDEEALVDLGRARLHVGLALTVAL